MSRSSGSSSPSGPTVGLLLIVGALAALVFSQRAELRRYMQMRSM
jgi:hypothetical protein